MKKEEKEKERKGKVQKNGKKKLHDRKEEKDK